MRTFARVLGFSAIFAAAMSQSFAEPAFTITVDVSGTPMTRDPRIPVAGDYTFTFGTNQARVASPNGKVFLFDFSKGMFTSIDPTRQTFYQMPIFEVLALGNRPPVPSSLILKGAIDFTQESGQSARSILDKDVKPYHFNLEAVLNEPVHTGVNYKGGFDARTGLIFTGGSPTSRPRTENRGCRLTGELSLADTPHGINRDQMNTSIECILLWCAPELKEFSERVHHSDLAILGATFSVGSYGSNQTGSLLKVPIVSLRVTGQGEGILSESSMSIPANCKLGTPPGPPWGG